MALEALRIGYPARIGRPGKLELTAGRVERVGIDPGWAARCDVNEPQVQMVVLHRQRLAVGRPGKVGIERARREGDDLRAGVAELVVDSDLVFAGGVGEPRELPAVRRPRRRALVDAGAACQIAGVTLFSRHSEDVTTGREHGARASGRQRRLGDHRRHFLEMAGRPGEIAVDLDVQLPRRAAWKINNMDVAGLFKDDRVGPRACVHDVEVVVAGELPDFLRVEAVGEEVGGEVPVGEKVDVVAYPHWVAVVAVPPRQLFDGKVGEVHDPHRACAAAAVMTPEACLVPGRHENKRDLLIGEVTGVG